MVDDARRSGARQADVSAWLDGVLDVLFPPSCSACGELGAEPFCAYCSEATLPAEPFTIEGVSKAVAVFAFGGPVAEAVRHLKYHDRPDLGRPLGRVMRLALERFDPYDVVVPMPPSDRRLRERGYDQARELVRGMGLAVDTQVLLRITEPIAQVGLDREARTKNLDGAFAVGRSSVTGRRVLLIDDIVTTGATARAAAAALGQSGASDVQLLALARTGA